MIVNKKSYIYRWIAQDGAQGMKICSEIDYKKELQTSCRIDGNMDIKQLNEIRKLVIVALFSDDDLMDVFVLKGGNAISLVYDVDYRASQDIDVSIAGDFATDELDAVKKKLERALIKTFNERGYSVFDVKLEPRPAQFDEHKKDFWGGYQLEFKIIESGKYEVYKTDLAALRRRAVPVREDQRKIFKVDISKHEFCTVKEPRDLEGHRVYVYTPVMVIYEKLRAICQQMEAYCEIVHSHQPRAGTSLIFISLLKSRISGKPCTIRKTWSFWRKYLKPRKCPLSCF